MSPIHNYIKENKQDAILWLSARWLKDAGDDYVRFGDATDRIVNVLSLVRNAIVQQRYIDDLIKKYKIPRKAFTSKVLDKQDKNEADNASIDEDEYRNMPKWMDRVDIMEKGFCTVKTDNVVGYYGWGTNGKTRISNFIIHPIFHIDKKEDSEHIFDVENDYRRTTLIVPSKAMVSKDLLQGFLVGAGSSYIFFGSGAQLLLVADHLLRQFHTCNEISFLGWQPEGFFAYVNRIYVPSKKDFVEISEYGVAEVAEKHYLIPAASKIYSNTRAGDDPFESARVMKLVKAPVTFKQWANQMHLVYGEKGLISVAFALAACFRDIGFAIDNNFPHMYFYGERSSGKSKCAESVGALFFVGRAAFNLNSGTDFAFFSYMQRFINCIAHLNEFDDKVIRPEWFQAIKGIFDGEGRERGKMGSRNRTEVMRVLCALILTGQYLSTQDDNSIVSRSIIVPFYEQQFTEQAKRNYEQLKAWESEGLTSLLVEILQHREEVKTKYYDLFNETLSTWRRATTGNYNQRILQNWCHLATCWFIFYEKLGLPIDFVAFSDLAYKEAIKYSKFIRDTDTLSDFWNTIEFLLDQGLITDGWDFKIEVKSEIKLRKGDGTEEMKPFDSPKKLLIIRLNNVHKLYEQAYRQRKGEKAMTFENLSHYFANRDYYIGQLKQTQFKKYEYQIVEKPNGNLIDPGVNPSNELKPKTSITSAYVFDYELLGCELERNIPEASKDPF